MNEPHVFIAEDAWMSRIVRRGFVPLRYSPSFRCLANNAIGIAGKLFCLSDSDKARTASPLVNPYDSGWSTKGEDVTFERWHVDLERPEVNWPRGLEHDLHIFTDMLRMIRTDIAPLLDAFVVSRGVAEPGELAHELTIGSVRARLMLYKPSNQAERFPAHVDRGVATIFVAESVPGLEIRNAVNSGGWRWADMNDGGILGVGESLALRASMPALEHRVASVHQERISIAVFLHSGGGRFHTLTADCASGPC